jgi:DNA-binding MarR family transcriptional regulator
MTPAQIKTIKAHPFAFTRLAARYEASIAKAIQKAVAAELRAPINTWASGQVNRSSYPEIAALFTGNEALAVAEVADAIGEDITTTENRLSSMTTRGFLRVEHVIRNGRRVKGHCRADAPMISEGRSVPCNPLVAKVMDDGRERTASDIAVRLGVPTKTLSKDLAKMCRDKHLVLREVRAGSGPRIKTYCVPKHEGTTA